MGKLTINTSGKHPHIVSGVKTSKAPTIGFEWEVPITGIDAYVDRSRTALEPFRTKMHKVGFKSHFECGGVELVSPSASTLTDLRSIAKVAREVVSQTQYLNADTRGRHGCGIHVHIKPIGVPNASTIFSCINGMINHSTSARFIMAFSDRRNATNYRHQAEVTKWDKCETGYRSLSLGQSPDNGSLRLNTIGTFEYRLFGSKPELLIPAIEFAHSTYLFCKTKRVPPSLAQYKEWLFKRKGYNALKDYADWSLI
jgi:hypothetical protein